MSETVSIADDGIHVSRYSGPSSLLDRRRIDLRICDGTMRATPRGPEAIRDFSFSEATELMKALQELMHDGA